MPIASAGGLEFCSTCAYGPTGNGSALTCKPSQLWGSAGTAAVLTAVLGEMAALFTDEVFHIGADETFVKAGATERCHPNTTALLERHVVEAVARDFKKTPAGWEQVLFLTGAATNDTIVYAYMSNASRVTATGHKAVVANGSSLYFTAAAPGGAAGWDKVWYDIGFDVPPGERSLLLGGEMSMWTDTYCSPRECGAMPAYHVEKGGALYNRSRDAAYGQSLGGMVREPSGYIPFFTPFIRPHCHMYIYVHPLYTMYTPYIHLTRLLTPYIHPKTTYLTGTACRGGSPDGSTRTPQHMPRRTRMERSTT